ncbi:hypothetical protein [Chitinophaga pinensis]|uniref:Uncharacterized protein n=1 Tax=Chitinophaga pinensis (strain ATCC 43595 / DSM 2588 / LMG 13176 / NBRC 15968 / NCIMB 11800 / UQM 2034) TaxID=485918 RepID=A0A979G9I8_CHIPD|nr:hypothetical protein [Chitinophaga pinensis]ACU63429.1 hypothetical protein Cpin_6015 [Chitinophaga pinensis DSM 2588]
MLSHTENLLNTFDETAHLFANSIYTEFIFSIKDVDRLKNENTFQLWTRKYTGKLKQLLEGQAMEYISTNRDLATIDWFHKKLVNMIRLHLQEFSYRAQYVS